MSKFKIKCKSKRIIQYSSKFLLLVNAQSMYYFTFDFTFIYALHFMCTLVPHLLVCSTTSKL